MHTVGAVDLELPEGPIMGAVVHKRKRLCIAKRAALSRHLNALNTSFTEVVSTATGDVGRAKDQQADGTLGLEVTWRWLDKLTLISEAALSIPFTVGA